MIKCAKKMAKTAQSVCRLCKGCVRVCEGVSESSWNQPHCISQLEYILLNTHHFEITRKLAEIAQSVLKVGEEGVRVCERVCESVWKYHNWISQLKFMHLGSDQLKKNSHIWEKVPKGGEGSGPNPNLCCEFSRGGHLQSQSLFFKVYKISFKDFVNWPSLAGK